MLIEKIEVISESRPDRGGFVGVDIRYLRRDEDGSVFMNEIGCESKTCLHAIGNDGYRRGGRDLAFTHGFVDGGFDFANGTERLRKRVVVAMEGSGESRQEKTIYR